MFPLHDTVKARVFPLITYLIIAANSYIFFLEITAPDLEVFVRQYALIPANINFSNIETLIPFITSQFLHAGFIHIISNMWFLKVFGDNVEERFGKLQFLFIYILSGAIGGFIQYLFIPNSTIPMLGASGAIAGVLGAYLVFFPGHKVETLIPLGLFITSVNIPASLMLVYWLITQLFSGVGAIADTQTGGIAFWAHIGGFAFGWLVAHFIGNNSANDAEEGEVLDL